MAVFRDERIWRLLCTIWTVVFMAFVVVNFFLFDKYSILNAPLSAVYASILALYVGTKEFDRWYDFHESGRHPGELFIIAWTGLIFFLGGFVIFSGRAYTIAPEIVANYVMVLSIFALTQKSKQLHHRRRAAAAKAKKRKTQPKA
jgi:hypothetical protein